MKQIKNAELNYSQKAVIENAKWVDSVLLSGITFGGIIIIAKAIGTREFDLHDLKISVDYAWILFTFITIAHFYVSWLLNRAIQSLWETKSDENCKVVFDEIQTAGGIFVRGFSPRTKVRRTNFGMHIFEMKLDDPSTWAAIIFALLLIVAIVPFDLTNLKYFFVMLLVAVVFATINWLIGSRWIISLSELAIPHSESILLSRKLEASEKSVSIVDALLALTFASGPDETAFRACGPVLLGLLAIIGTIILFVFLIRLGYGGLLIKSLVALGAFIIFSNVLKKVLLIRRFGRLLFILLFTIISGLIITGYILWIK